MSSPMGPPLMVPVKRSSPQYEQDDEEHPFYKPRVELGDDIPDEVSQQDIQHMLDQADDVHIEVLNEGALKRMVMQLDRKIKTNQSLRIKHADEPDKFLKSEVDLDEEVKRFTGLTTHPELYSELIALEALPRLVGLLNHVNTDISVDVFEVLSELTDPDVIAEVPEPECFVKELFQAQLCEMSVDVLLRIDESASEEDAKAVTNCLTMFENLADISPQETCNQLADIPRMLPWLVKRVRAGSMDYNKVYAAEILGILLQNSAATREAMLKLEGVDKLLRGISGYRKKDPSDSEESEYVQNMFDCLCSLMLLPEHQVVFGKVQGLELMIRIVQQHNFSSPLAVRLADHAMRHCPTNCQMFVEKVGLKVLFPLFMKKGWKAKATRSEIREMEEHVTSMIQSLCRYCTGTPVARVLNKFMEGNFEKLERLLDMHDEYLKSVRESDAARSKGLAETIDRELEVDEDEQLFLDRCDAGLFTLQQIDIILVRLATMGNRQATEEICKLLDTKGVSIEEVVDVLAEYCSHLDESAKSEIADVKSKAMTLVKRFVNDSGTVNVLQSKLGLNVNGEKDPSGEKQSEELTPDGEVDAPTPDGEEEPVWGNENGNAGNQSETADPVAEREREIGTSSELEEIRAQKRENKQETRRNERANDRDEGKKREKDPAKDKERDRKREREIEKERERNRGKEREKERGKEKNRDKEREKEREKDKGRDKEKGRDRRDSGNERKHRKSRRTDSRSD